MPLNLNRSIVCALPTKCSRHNSSSRAHAVYKLVRNNTWFAEETIVVR